MIREAEHADIDSVCLIEKEVFKRPWSESSFVAELTKVNCDFLVYEINGEVAGYIIFWYILDEGEVGNIAVSPLYRRKGIARKLLDACILMHPEVSNIYLEVDKTNAGAICLYSEYGFEDSGTIKDYYGKGMDALRMYLSIPKNEG
ncbi:ribosomal-protein-alanine acetyltransferase [Denitrovibrio acetiphilus DSM 12809]|uniref:[Ribosomal protein bS18]-alanine N-acetyltransferase n=1 Tax=Denitrovibrio acetiphilus (strain DSM 12809 / NBRC 114555 / N2460) TaxID=522772 RepID=D4H865_DENA2|nr:ribosomal protein S18-alanine N-acetyltransferase [Denitrovibrio acetiphilus]ADD68214.1 ribosomal-protein-alanine acetyltransferase [Denitrovibrio acetiphilus DSM 12809]